MGHPGSHDRYPARAVLNLSMQRTNSGQYTYESLTRTPVVFLFSFPKLQPLSVATFDTCTIQHRLAWRV